MRKLLVIVGFFSIFSLSSQAFAYGYGFYSYPYYFSSMTQAEKINFGVANFFDTAVTVWDTLERNKINNKAIEARQEQIDQYKSIQRYQTQGIPAFSPVAPDGNPRPPSITWQDVQDIR